MTAIEKSRIAWHKQALEIVTMRVPSTESLRRIAWGYLTAERVGTCRGCLGGWLMD